MTVITGLVGFSPFWLVFFALYMTFFCIATANITGQVEWFRVFCLVWFSVTKSSCSPSRKKWESFSTSVLDLSTDCFHTPTIFSAFHRSGDTWWFWLCSPLLSTFLFGLKSWLWCGQVDVPCVPNAIAPGSQPEWEVPSVLWEKHIIWGIFTVS